MNRLVAASLLARRRSSSTSCKNDMFGSPLNGFGGNTRAGFALRLGSFAG